MIVVNTKNYRSGRALLRLVRLIKKFDSKIVVAVPSTEIYQVSRVLRTYAQHADVTDEKSTGFTSVCDIKAAGARGTILNHSEHPLNFSVLSKTMADCRKHKLKTIICVARLGDVRRFARLKPDAIAFEDPKLIGSGKSITSYKPATLSRFVALLKGTKILPMCGAGISSAADVKAAYGLGCKGVLVASAIANSSNPRAFLRALSA